MLQWLNDRFITSLSILVSVDYNFAANRVLEKFDNQDDLFPLSV